jgi:imidazoleglycerol phosphate dehydratase HisB
VAFFVPFDFREAEPLDSLLKDVTSATRRNRITERYLMEQKIPQSVQFLEFFQGFTNHAQVTLHIDNLRGDNSHHQAETVFKAFGRALRMALTPDPRMAGVTPSTKGVL